ncbi:glycoside hydrolase family 18 protein [Mycena olivaceomarginata]|nr:glycoside hydrolase family 18 protein [Mycena olivaceomarginata]
MSRLFSSVFSALVLSTVTAFAYDPTRADNDTCIDVIPIAFVDSFSGGIPDLSLGNENSFLHSICNDNGVTGNCASLAAGIQACQAKGKLVTLSLGGGGTTTARFASDSAATSFADIIWNNFLGGSGSHRPFGAAVLDGVDLDIESGTNTGYAAFAARIRTRWAGASKPYYITAAPQCPFPDAWVGTALNTVQFYKGAPNPNVKVFIGCYIIPVSAANAGEYISASTLDSIAAATRAEYSNFDGVMLW